MHSQTLGSQNFLEEQGSLVHVTKQVLAPFLTLGVVPISPKIFFQSVEYWMVSSSTAC